MHPRFEGSIAGLTVHEQEAAREDRAHVGRTMVVLPPAFPSRFGSAIYTETDAGISSSTAAAIKWSRNCLSGGHPDAKSLKQNRNDSAVSLVFVLLTSLRRLTHRYKMIPREFLDLRDIEKASERPVKSWTSISIA